MGESAQEAEKGDFTAHPNRQTPTTKKTQLVAKYQSTEHPCSLSDKLGAVVRSLGVCLGVLLDLYAMLGASGYLLQ